MRARLENRDELVTAGVRGGKDRKWEGGARARKAGSVSQDKEFGLHPICGRKGLEDSKQGMNTLEGSLCTILTAAAVCIMDHVGAQTLRFTKICC